MRGRMDIEIPEQLQDPMCFVCDNFFVVIFISAAYNFENALINN